MVRRATLDRGAQPSGHTAAAGAAPGVPELAEPADGQTGKPWRGSGGRWLVWTFRFVVWAVLLIIGYRGVTAIVMPDKNSSGESGAPAAAPNQGFPVALAEAYALQFGSVYLNFSPADADERARQLATFLPSGASDQLGWNGAGSLQLQSEQVAGIKVADSQHAVVTLLARASGQLFELGVPVYAADGGLSISAEPALLPPPARVAQPEPPGKSSDPGAADALGSQLPAFFQAYASGDPVTLGRFLAPGATVTGLGGSVTYHSIAGLYVPPGGDSRTITVSVLWHVQAGASSDSPDVSTTPAGLEMTYQMQVIRQDGSWYVKSIGTSLQPLAQP
jgi:Conjugative transposon protein TcpC